MGEVLLGMYLSRLELPFFCYAVVCLEGLLA
jgi:hypothetical protein